MPYKIEQNKAIARPRNIGDQPGQLRFGEMMRRYDADGHIGLRQTVGYRVPGDDRNRRIRRRRTKIESDHLST